MSNLPLRNLGATGILSDVNPYDLQPNAFSRGSNVIFDEGTVQRAPLFKQLFPAIKSAIAIDDYAGTYEEATAIFDSAEGAPVSDVRFVSSYADPAAGETIFVCDSSGEIRGYPNGNLQFLTPGSGLVTNDNPWTHAQIAGISFLARKGALPLVRHTNDINAYEVISGDWDSTHTASIIRGYNDFAVAFNIVKGTDQFPTMVKWSNSIEYEAPFAEIVWDPTNPNYNSGENVLGEITSPIRDALMLGGTMVIYAKDQVWLMEYKGDQFVFDFRRLFPTGGILNTNCVAEVDGKHFVFGDDDIYAHDGLSKQSLADTKVRRYIYSTLDRAKLNACYVQHDPVTNLVFFCYSSKETDIGFPATQFCNKAAVFNYQNGTWSFMDLPNVAGGATVNVDLSENLYLLAGASLDDLYDTSAGAPTGSAPRLAVMLSAPSTVDVTASRVFAIDSADNGIVKLEPLPEVLRDAYVERTGLDMDDPGLGLSLRSYKTIDSIVPQLSFNGPSGSIRWRVGAADKSKDPVVWRSDQTFDPNADYKLDMRVAGRYLAYRIDISSTENFVLSGFDAEVKSFSHR